MEIINLPAAEQNAINYTWPVIRQVSWNTGGQMIPDTFEDLAQSLRVFLEAWVRFPDLVAVDRAEACGNIDTTFTSILNSYHSLYDSIKLQLGSHPIDWYATPELCFILALRNARHHNTSNKIRSIYTYHARTSDHPSDTKDYLIVDFQPREEQANWMHYYVSWSDYYDLLKLPSEKSKLRVGTKELIYNYIGGGEIESYTASKNISRDMIFVNAIPLVVNAGIAIYPHIRNYINTSLSTESRHFDFHFREVLPFDTSTHIVSWMSLDLPD